MLAFFVDSSEFRELGHIFPFYSYIVKIFNHRANKITDYDELEEYH